MALASSVGRPLLKVPLSSTLARTLTLTYNLTLAPSPAFTHHSNNSEIVMAIHRKLAETAALNGKLTELDLGILILKYKYGTDIGTADRRLTQTRFPLCTDASALTTPQPVSRLASGQRRRQ